MTVDEFCKQYRINDEDKEQLKEQHYKPRRMKLSKFTDGEREKMGFTVMTWKHIVNADRRYHSDI